MNAKKNASITPAAPNTRLRAASRTRPVTRLTSVISENVRVWRSNFSDMKSQI
ncbi:MAG: hypothetical protein ACYS1B_17605 [Planctomycetota bacterium]|jgi:hypothetical protein